jgi:hypothetical protein
VLGQSVKLTLIGIGIGFVGAVTLTRFLASLLYGWAPFLVRITYAIFISTVEVIAFFLPLLMANCRTADGAFNPDDEDHKG